MSAFNAERTIAASLHSILTQTEKDLELVCINDGSTDSTGEIVESIARTDKRLRYYVQTNKGLTSSLVYAASVATGIYFARQDADDISFPDRLRSQVEFLKTNDLDMVSTRAIIESSSRIGPRLSSYIPVRFQLLYCNPIIHGSMLMKTESYHQVGGYNENYRYSQDYDLSCRLLLARKRIAVIKKCLYFLGSPESRVSVVRAKEQEEAFRRIRNGYRLSQATKISRRIFSHEV